MKHHLYSRICLAFALLITVYNYFISDKPVETYETGTILILLVAANILSMMKRKEA
ncbi:hypothetical protein ACFYKX_09030 [Cytobacillus sp. FJAT-54145]|uniref:Uncharacterized protein n=1 Tax=Cytobacillus spartinae TaxID=3299023 RepID=A0ABW6K989_9BACI